MKVIFIEDVQNVARAGQTKDVANGYARNFLFPRKLAVLANSQAAAMVEAHLKKVLKQRALEEAEMAELAKKINGVEVTIKAKVGENDRLYGSVTGADVAEMLTKNIGREIDKRKVDLTEPIRQVGSYDVVIRFTHEITATVKVNVMSEEATEAKPENVEKKLEKAEEKSKKTEEKAEVAAPKKEKTEKKEKAEKKEKTEKKEKPSKAEKEPKEAKAEKPESEEKPDKEEKKEKKPKVKTEKKSKKSETGDEEGEKKES